MTPRKPKQRQQQHHHHRVSSTHHAQVQVSDYESDVLTYNANHSHAIPPPTRTNTELNLSVLRRYNPAVRTILSIAANAVIYLFSPNLQQWEKSGIEGTLFVCDTDPLASTGASGGGEDGYCIIVLNRHGLNNLILDLRNVMDVEVASDLLSIRFLERDDETQAQLQKVMGIWIHADRDDTREINATLIQQCWEKAAASKGRNGEHAQSLETGGAGAPSQGISANVDSGGRRISLSDLFKPQGS